MNNIMVDFKVVHHMNCNRRGEMGEILLVLVLSKVNDSME